MDILEHITEVQREVSRTGETATVLMRRTYQAGTQDLWDALTDPERMARWFSKVTGEFKVGGSFQISGNAGGEILECEPPTRYKVTFGGPTSLLEVRLTPGPDDTTDFVLEHSMESPPAPGGAGALYVGPGWDGAVAGLALYLDGDLSEDTDPMEMANSPEVVQYNEACINAWIEVIRASGTTTEQDLEEAIAISMAQYVPDEQPPQN